MNNLKLYIIEKLKVNKDSKKYELELPEIGTFAKDYNGDEWEILDFCKFEDKEKMKNIIKKYDHNGCFTDLINIEKEYEPKENDKNIFVVAAKMKNNNIDAVWLWGPGFLYY